MFITVPHFFLGALSDITQSQTDELITGTLDQYKTEVINHTALEIPVYRFFLASPHKQTVTGGHRIRFPVQLDKNDSFAWFGLNDNFDPQPKKILGWGHVTLKQGAGDVTIEDLEEWMNSGPGKIVDITKQKVADLEQSIKENLNRNAWSDGTGSGGKEPTGLTGWIPNTPTTGTWMGFDISTNYWPRIWYWDNATYGPHSLTSPTGSAVQAVGAIGDISDGFANIIPYLDNLWASIAKDQNASDIFHITDLQTQLAYFQIPLRCKGFDIGVHDSNFNMGIPTAHYMGAPVLSDTIENGAISGEWRTVNTRYYYMIVDGAHFFEWVGPRHPYNALRTARYLVVRFAFVNTYPRKQGLLTGITAWTA